MHFLLLFTVSIFSLSAAFPFKKIEQEWLNFNVKYGKNYRSVESYNKRFKNFKENFNRIVQHNKLFEKKVVTYEMAVNPFTDMNLKEMKTSYMGLKISEIEKRNFRSIPIYRGPKDYIFNLPASIDWRERGAITSVKNQLACGSCWAFASTGALEAHYFLKYNKTVILSEQNLVDCVNENFGCEGGWMIPSFDYVHTNGGINSETKYPYEAVDGQCRYQSKYVAATCHGYTRIRQHDEQHLLNVVATKGPVAVAIEVNSNFMSYVGGIYDDVKCSQFVNHAVLVVGYGTENGQDYWLVKNSWGTDWGDRGYIKMARNKHNQCAIASYAVYPLM